MQNKRATSNWLCVVSWYLLLLSVISCHRSTPVGGSAAAAPAPSSVLRPLPANASPQLRQLVEAAIEQSKVTTGYDSSWVKIDYPNGDVSSETGVCSDVVVRAFRKVGIDLQKDVHEDMKRNFSAYPTRWGLSGPDANIDHRRVPNLMTYFTRQGKSLSTGGDS